MGIPIQLIAFSIPSLIYMLVRRRYGEKWTFIFKKLGWRSCSLKFFLWGLGVAILIAGLGWVALQFVPPAALQGKVVNKPYYAGWSLNLKTFVLVFLVEAFYTALGEEIFFRGFLGNWLMRRLGFLTGNTLQALIFLLPHLLLLLVSIRFWPILPVQFFAGWLAGWLLYHSESIIPGWLVHSLINAVGVFVRLV